jgi:O-antigen ligase
MNQGVRKARARPLPEKTSAFAAQWLFVSLCASIGFETLFFYTGIGNAFTVPKAVALLLGAAVVIPQICLVLARPQLSRPMRLLLVLAGFQIAVVAFSTLRSISPAVSFWGGDWRRMGWIAQCAMLAIAVSVPLAVDSDWRRWKRLLQFIAIAGIISAGYGILQWMDWDPFLPGNMRQKIIAEFAGVYRSSGTIGQPAYFANYLLYPFFSALALVVLEKGASRILNICGIAVIAAGIGFTGSRNGMLGCAAGVAAFAVFALLRRRSPGLVLGLVLALLLCVVVVERSTVGASVSTPSNASGSMRALDFLRFRLASAGTDSASIGRMVLWSDVVSQILPNVWLSGTGPGMFRVAFTRFRSNNYSTFDPDVHWENAHNLFLDRLTEQGIPGLLAILFLIAAFVLNVSISIRLADNRSAYAVAAIGSGMVAVLVSHSFIGELIPTTFYFYLWVAISFASRQCAEKVKSPQAPAHKKSLSPRIVLAASLVVSVTLIWYAERNWRSESMLRAGEDAVNSGSLNGLLNARSEAERSMPFVGTYHLEFARLLATYLGRPHPSLDGNSRRRIAGEGIASASWALQRTDRPMLALQDMILLADMSGDSRFEGWIQDLRKMDPYWYRPHEMAARLMLRQRKYADALREATIARELSPFTPSTIEVWKQLLAIQGSE